MPIGSPGMEQGDTTESYEVPLVHDGETSVFASHRIPFGNTTPTP
jgi:hypothetical protein